MQREWQARIREKLRQVAPGVFVIVLMLASCFQYPIPGISLVFPLFLAMAVYYWCLYWPQLFPQWFTFLMGLLLDILNGLPLGISAFAYLLLWWLVRSQRRYLYKETFSVVWGGFAVASILFGIITWATLSAYYGILLPWQDAAMQAVLTVLFYPAVHLAFTRLTLSLLKV